VRRNSGSTPKVGVLENELSYHWLAKPGKGAEKGKLKVRRERSVFEVSISAAIHKMIYLCIGKYPSTH